MKSERQAGGIGLWKRSYLLVKGGAAALSKREWIYAGEPVPDLNDQEYTALLRNVQRAVLFSLEARGMLTASERSRCEAALTEEYTRKLRK